MIAGLVFVMVDSCAQMLQGLYFLFIPPKQASRYYYYIIQKMRASSKMGFRFVSEPETSKFKKIAFDLSIRNALLVLLHFVLSVERDLCS